MKTVHNWFQSLEMGTHRRPANVTAHEIEHEVKYRYSHLASCAVAWINADTFKLVCKCCGK